MRTKSSARRQAILKVAAQTFRELGFEGASMCEIRARVGGSKATLYSYFASKEELFFEVIFNSIEDEFEATHAHLDSGADDIAEALTVFGEGLLRSLYQTPGAIAVRRLIFAESRRSDLGRICYERGVAPSHGRLASFLRAAMDRGKLRDTDASVAAWHLYGLLDAELFRRCFLCVQETVTEEEMTGCVQRAVAVFMAAYGTPTNQSNDLASRPRHDGRVNESIRP